MACWAPSRARICLAALVVSAFGVFSSAPAFAERRVALVIGNAAYQNVPKLRTPTSDADHVSAVLRRLDFQVTEAKDLDKLGMEQVLRRFAEDISGADVALFYFSGHGAQVADDNYILPTSARIDNQRSLALDTFAVLDINTLMKSAGAHVQLLFLDACRNNPFAERFVTTRSATRGLAPVEAGGGSLIAFSAGPGQVAQDGAGDVSPFTEGFLKYVTTPNIEVRQMMGRIRGYVSDETDKFQIPWDNSSLLEDVYLVPKRAPPAFDRLTRAHLPSDGQGLLKLAAPIQPDGGKVRVRIEQAPALGRLWLADRELSTGDEIEASAFGSLSYRSSGAPTTDAFSFRVLDDWGHSDVGLVTIDFARPGELVAATAPEQVRTPIDASLTAVSLIGLGPNLRYRDASLPATPATASLRLTEDPPFGQFRLGERVLAKDRTVTVADLSHLTFLPPVGVEGKAFEAHFAAADGAPDTVKVKVNIEITDCDRLAGDRLDTQGVSEGVFPGRINLEAALPACETAVKLQPKSGRFAYELARIYAALGRNDEAAATYQKAADLGHVRALWALGYRALYLRPVDAPKGIKLLQQAQAAGDVFADHTLAQAYYEGRGVEKDWVKARKLFEKAAAVGHTFSMNSLGRMYQRGETVAPDVALARRYWEESAARGDIYGLDNVGFVYLEGIGAPKDPAQALDYFKKAADLGHPEAPNNIGRLYLLGLGVQKDVGEARRWYGIGMSRGDAWAAYNLGELARDGVGAPPDKVRAGYYFARAAASINRPEPSDLGRKALADLDDATKLASLRLLTADLDPAALTASDSSLPTLARKAIAHESVTPADSGLDGLMIGAGQAIFVAQGVRTDLF